MGAKSDQAGSQQSGMGFRPLHQNIVDHSGVAFRLDPEDLANIIAGVQDCPDIGFFVLDAGHHKGRHDIGGPVYDRIWLNPSFPCLRHAEVLCRLEGVGHIARAIRYSASIANIVNPVCINHLIDHLPSLT